MVNNQTSTVRVKRQFFLGLGVLISLIYYSVLRQYPIAGYEFAILFSATLIVFVFDYLKTSQFLTLIEEHRKNQCSLELAAQTALKATLKSPFLLKLVRIELLTLYYAFFAKAERHDVVFNNRQFSYVESSNAYDVFLFVALSQLPFLPFIHFFLEHQKGPAPAWVLSLLTLWSVIWYLAQAEAVKFRPIELSDKHLKYRFGLFWKADIPIEKIKLARVIDPFHKPDEGDLFSSPFGSKRNIFLEFESPVRFIGPYFLKTRAKKAAISLDRPSHFLKQLAERGVVTG